MKTFEHEQSSESSVCNRLHVGMPQRVRAVVCGEKWTSTVGTAHVLVTCQQNKVRQQRRVTHLSAESDPHSRRCLRAARGDPSPFEVGGMTPTEARRSTERLRSRHCRACRVCLTKQTSFPHQPRCVQSVLPTAVCTTDYLWPSAPQCERENQFGARSWRVAARPHRRPTYVVRRSQPGAAACQMVNFECRTGTELGSSQLNVLALNCGHNVHHCSTAFGHVGWALPGDVGGVWLVC